MKRALAPSLIALWLTLSASVTSGAEIVLAPDTSIRILEQGDFGNTEGSLRDLLANYLLLALKKDTLTGPGELVTFIIEARANSWQQIPREELREISDVDAFEIRIAPAIAPTVRITGATVVAAGFGVTHFLEKYLGVFWALPGDLGLCIPKESTFRLPEGEERLAPVFFSRSCTGFVFREPALRGELVAREGLLHDERGYFYGYDYFKSLRLHALASPSHNMVRVFAPELRDTDSEVFPTRDGARWFPPARTSRGGGPWAAWHPCYTHPKTVDIAAAKAREAFRDGTLCYSLGVSDGRKTPCECDECTRVGFPRSYYGFVTRVAERVQDLYPPHLIGVLAYGDVRYPPEDLALPENVLVMVAGGGPELPLQWSGHARLLGTYEYFQGQGFWVPQVPLAAMRSNARFCREHGIRSYRGEVYPMWAFDAPRVYLRARLLWEPDLDLDAGLRRFCDAAFDRGGGYMHRFYKRWATLREDDVAPKGLTPTLPRGPEGLHHDPVRQFHECTPADFENAGYHLAQARTMARSDRAEKRLTMIAAFFDDSKALFRMCNLASEAFGINAPPDAETRIAETLGLRRKHYYLLEEMHAHPEWFAGTSASVDDDLVPSWEQRSAVSVLRMAENAVIADVFRLNEQGASVVDVPEEFRRFQQPFQRQPARLGALRSHAWYADERQYVPLRAEADGRAVRFESAAPTRQRSDHPAWLGARKHHWMAGNVRDVPIDGRSLYLIDLAAEGRGGRLVVRVLWRANRSIRRDVMLIEDLAAEMHRVQMRIPIEPTMFHARTLRNEPAPADGAAGTISIYLTWEPVEDDAPLQGTCSARHVAFEP